MIFSSWHFLFNNSILWFLKINLLCKFCQLAMFQVFHDSEREGNECLGWKSRANIKLWVGYWVQNREVYLGTWLVHFKSVSHTFYVKKDLPSLNTYSWWYKNGKRYIELKRGLTYETMSKTQNGLNSREGQTTRNGLNAINDVKNSKG